MRGWNCWKIVQSFRHNFRLGSVQEGVLQRAEGKLSAKPHSLNLDVFPSSSSSSTHALKIARSFERHVFAHAAVIESSFKLDWINTLPAIATDEQEKKVYGKIERVSVKENIYNAKMSDNSLTEITVYSHSQSLTQHRLLCADSTSTSPSLKFCVSQLWQLFEEEQKKKKPKKKLFFFFFF